MLKVALVHDWFTGMRGGEYVFEAIAELFPQAEVFTLLYVPGTVSPALTVFKRHTSWLQKVPRAESRYRYFLPLMPQMIEGFDLSGFDLIISSSHCVAKGIRKPKDAVHISYVHAPMRYIWDRFDDYFGPGRASLPVRIAVQAVRGRLQDWDRRVSSKRNVDLIIANSHFIREQVQSAYHRDDAEVIFPFVDLDRFGSLPYRPSRNYLMVGAFAPYKRTDIAIEAFNQLKLPLLIVGNGQDEARLKKIAGPTIDFLGSLSHAAIADLYSKAKALIFPGKEDFGITPLEAMASGAPVVALGEGGVLDTVTDKTGILFASQNAQALKDAVLRLERGDAHFSEQDCKTQAAKFTKARFQSEFKSLLKKAWIAAGKDPERLPL